MRYRPVSSGKLLNFREMRSAAPSSNVCAGDFPSPALTDPAGAERVGTGGPTLDVAESWFLLSTDSSHAGEGAGADFSPDGLRLICPLLPLVSSVRAKPLNESAPIKVRHLISNS